MFDAVLGRAAAPRGRLGTGTTAAVAVHAAILAWAVSAPPPAPEPEDEPPQVTVFLPPPPPPPLLGGGAPKSAPKPEKRPRPARRDVAVIPKAPLPETPPEAPQEAAPDAPEGPGDPNGDPLGHPDGKVGGVLGGDPRSTVIAPPPPPPPPPKPRYEVIPFSGGMQRPVLLSGAPPAYTREARAARVEGMMVVRCVITTEGLARDCRIIKGLPHLEDAALRALATHRYRPMIWNGRPANVQYVFNFRFKLEN